MIGDPPSDLVATTISSARIDISWKNNDAYDFIRVYRGKGDNEAAAIAALAPYVRRPGSSEYMEDKGWEAGVEVGLEAKEWYAYKIFGFLTHPYEATDFSNTDAAETFEALQKPTLVVATPFSDIEIEITFKDNSASETHHNIERGLGADPGAWVTVIAELEPNREFFRDGGIFMTLAGYTDCVATDIGEMVEAAGVPIGLLVEYDNIRRRWLVDTAGAIVTNDDAMTIPTGAGVGIAYGTTTGLIKGSSYTYQVRAEDLGGHTDWVPSNLATTISEPADPTALVISDVKDTSLQLSWTDNSANETGFRIEQSANGAFAGEQVEIAVIGADITEFLVTGLTASTPYWFRVYAYNAAGNSTNPTNVATHTTLAAYVPTEFEKWIRDPSIEPVYLVEIYTKMDLTEFGDEVGVTWKKTISTDDRGIDILEVFENGTAYTEGVVVAEELADPNTFYFDYDTRILYIHTTGDGDPADFLIEGAFWLYFSTHKDIEFNNNFYLPLLSKEDIPDITQEIKPYFEGNFLISSGSIAFINGKIGGAYFFDIKYKTHTWENSKLILKAGRNDFTYTNFKPILTSLIDKKSCNDNKITFTLRDIRQEMERSLTLNTFTIGEFPNIESDFIDQPIPICFGTKYRVVPVRIDATRRKYKFHDGRSKKMLAVYKNPTGVSMGTLLVEDVDYFVDLQRSIITFERDTFELGEEDIIQVAFAGAVNSADEPIANGAEIFKHLMNEHYGLLNSELNLDSIYKSKYAKTNELSIYLYKTTPYREIVRSIEHSMEAFTFQDVEGRLGLNPQLAAAESNAKYIENHNIFDHRQSKDRASLYWKVNVWYNENPQLQRWEVKLALDNNVIYRYKNRNVLNVYTYFSAPASAQALATSVLLLLNKERIENTISMLLFDVMAGDIVKFSRTRFYDVDGTASEMSLRIIRISKSPASGQTTIIGEIV